MKPPKHQKGEFTMRKNALFTVAAFLGGLCKDGICRCCPRPQPGTSSARRGGTTMRHTITMALALTAVLGFFARAAHPMMGSHHTVDDVVGPGIAKLRPIRRLAKQ